MICEKVQHFKVQHGADRPPEFIATDKKTRSPKTSAAGIASGTLLILLAPPVQAANITFVSDRTTLGGSDRLDWSSLRPVQPPFKILPNSFSVTSEGGLGISVNIPQATTPGITPPLVF